jgi:hypothetical protein
MSAQATELSARQERAILALLTSGLVAGTAKRARVGERTLRGWLKDAGFLRACRQARRDVFEQAVSRLQRVGNKAVSALGDCLKAGNRASGRIRAATPVPALGTKGVDQWDAIQRLDEVLARIADINKRLDQARGRWKGARARGSRRRPARPPRRDGQRGHRGRAGLPP